LGKGLALRVEYGNFLGYSILFFSFISSLFIILSFHMREKKRGEEREEKRKGMIINIYI
jgi:cytochrome oxidase assembly protein ShyY1